MSLEKAALYEKAEMHDAFVAEMRTFVRESESEPGDSEQKMLSNAYKSVVSKMRASWRAVSAIEEKLAQDEPKKALAGKYLVVIVDELTLKCQELLVLLENDLIPKLSKPKAKVFFLKMKGDHLRYLVEIASGEEENLEELKTKSKAAYTEAATLAAENLSATDPFRLGLALNFSVFYYEVENSQEKAYEMAKKAFDEAIGELDQLDDDAEADDVTTIMQLLRDNLTFWSEEI